MQSFECANAATLTKEVFLAVGSEESPTQQHVWVEKMEEFRNALFGLHKFLNLKSLTPERIKVRSCFTPSCASICASLVSKILTLLRLDRFDRRWR